MGLSKKADRWDVFATKIVERPERKGLLRRPTGRIISEEVSYLAESYPLFEGRGKHVTVPLMAQLAIFPLAEKQAVIQWSWSQAGRRQEDFMSERFNKYIDPTTGHLTETSQRYGIAGYRAHQPTWLNHDWAWHPLADTRFRRLLPYLADSTIEPFIDEVCRDCHDDIVLLERLQQEGYPVDDPMRMMNIGRANKAEGIYLPYNEIHRKIGRIATAMAEAELEAYKMAMNIDHGGPQRFRDPQSDAITRAAALIEAHYNMTDLDKR